VKVQSREILELVLSVKASICKGFITETDHKDLFALRVTGHLSENVSHPA